MQLTGTKHVSVLLELDILCELITYGPKEWYVILLRTSFAVGHCGEWYERLRPPTNTCIRSLFLICFNIFSTTIFQTDTAAFDFTTIHFDAFLFHSFDIFFTFIQTQTFKAGRTYTDRNTRPATLNNVSRIEMNFYYYTKYCCGVLLYIWSPATGRGMYIARGA